MADEELLRRLRAALERESVPVDDLVAAARDDAVAEARSILQALMTRSLLEQALSRLEDRGGSAGAAPRPPRPAVPDEPTPSAERPPPGTCWYVYGVQSARAAVPEVAGVGGAAVTGVDSAGLRALVSEVPVDEFGEEAIAARMEDLTWLGEQASAHEAVLASAFAAGTVVPLRFGTLFRARDGVIALLDDHGEAFRTELERFAGRSEWSVKVLADPDAVERWAAEHDPAAAAAPEHEATSEGHAYFARKQRRATLEAVRGRIVAGVAEDCHERLRGACVDARTARPQQAELSGLPGDMVLNGAYLVDDAEVDAFRAVVDELAGVHGPRGFDLRLSGPWPPHHFLSLPDVAEQSEAP